MVDFQMLENLVIALESDAQIVDIGRVSGFMQKVSRHLNLSLPYLIFVGS
jgi:hypothetical protein